MIDILTERQKEKTTIIGTLSYILPTNRITDKLADYVIIYLFKLLIAVKTA